METALQTQAPGTIPMDGFNTSTLSGSAAVFLSSISTSTTAMMMSDIVETTEFGIMNGTEDFMNGTTVGYSEPHYLTVLKTFQKWLLTVALVCIMLSMGAVITAKDFKETFRHPIGFVIGFLSQFITMPLICFLTALALGLETPFALGLLIIGCCPGGTVSNLFTFWTNGDVCLSVCMTSVSCVAAIGMMPLNLLIYSRRWTSEQTKVPFMNIFTTLVTIIVPAIAGMIVRRYNVKWASRVSQFGSIMGLATIPVSISLIGIINPGMFSASWKIWTSTTILPFVGYFFGYGVGRICRQPTSKCRTIGFETGIQNSALAVTIMLLTFADSDLLYDMLTVPCFYGIISFVDFLFYVAFFRARMHYRRRNAPTKMDEDEGEGGDTDKDEVNEKGKDIDQDCYHGNGIQIKYQPIPDDVTGTLTANGEKQPNKDSDKKNNEIKITINGDYQLLKSDDTTHDERNMKIIENPIVDTDVVPAV
ncbi:ileal sodium/bile acid cotransporter-like [Strongylocentrotus purpuratus]|uniref:Ileal sodium/bile acid cotransporter n=1 Tax=Strongylocentrotus purpuratus TaxID=7668 RepID=A0A7M7NJJ9_STRPU|nr:ileal sodium/bile acid cotransporter-like [Strongylocentrotus purpuratus]